MCCSFSELDLAGVVDGLDEHGPKVATTVAAHRTREAVSGLDVVNEEIQDLLARGFTFYKNGFNPSRQTISEDDELGVATDCRTYVGRHIKHVANQAVEGIGADVWGETPTLASVGALSEGARMAS